MKTIEEIQDLVEGYNALLKPQFQMDEAGIICLLNDIPNYQNLIPHYVQIFRYFIGAGCTPLKTPVIKGCNAFEARKMGIGAPANAGYNQYLFN